MLPPILPVLMALMTLMAGAAFAADDEVGRLQASIRNSASTRGEAFGSDIRGYFEAFLIVRTCNSIGDRATTYVGDAELSKVRWWLHTFQSALKLESGLLVRVGIDSGEIWRMAERNTEPFRRRAVPASARGSARPADALTSSEVATTCRTARDVFRSGEEGGPTKLSF